MNEQGHREPISAPSPISVGEQPTKEECIRAAGRVLLQIAIRLEIERRAAEVGAAEGWVR